MDLTVPAWRVRLYRSDSIIALNTTMLTMNGFLCPGIDRLGVHIVFGLSVCLFVCL